MREKIQTWARKPETRRDFLVGLLLITVAILVNLPAYLQVTHDRAMLNVLSLDEWSYATFLDSNFYSKFKFPDIFSIITISDPWGYGSLFWMVSGFFGLPAYAFHSFPAEIISLRILSAIWLGITLFFVYKIIFALRNDWRNALLGALALLCIPAYYFYSKAFSAEFMASAFAIASFYYLVLDQGQGTRSFYVAIGLLAIGAGVKISILTFAPVFIVYFLVIYRQRLEELIKVGLISLGIFFVCFIMTNPFLVISGSQGRNHYKSLLIANMEDNRAGHGQSIEGIDSQAWYKTVIQPDFLPPVFILLASIGYFLTITQQRRRDDNRAVILLAGALLFIFYTIGSVKKLWGWYLFPPFFLSLIGLYAINFNSYDWLKKYRRLEKPLLLLITLALLYSSYPAIIKRYAEVQSREKNPVFQAKVRSQTVFQDWLKTQAQPPKHILKSPYIYFDGTSYPELAVSEIWGTLRETSLKSYRPDLLLIEKDYGFLLPDEQISKWTSYPDILEERKLFSQLTNSEVRIDSERFSYRQTLETEAFLVYRRIQ